VRLRVYADYEWIAEVTERFSGSDLVSVCKESAMRPVRRLMKRLMRRGEAADNIADATLDLEPISNADVKAALACQSNTPDHTTNSTRSNAAWCMHSQCGSTFLRLCGGRHQTQRDCEVPRPLRRMAPSVWGYCRERRRRPSTRISAGKRHLK
jgi:SpoVK/Ycf46/Vps4 family AAA+-type ATPase